MMMITLLNAFIERQKITINGDGRSHWPFPTLPLANCGCKKIASRVLKGDARLKGTLFSSSLARSRISMTSRRRGETDTRRHKMSMGQKLGEIYQICMEKCTIRKSFVLRCIRSNLSSHRDYWMLNLHRFIYSGFEATIRLPNGESFTKPTLNQIMHCHIIHNSGELRSL